MGKLIRAIDVTNAFQRQSIIEVMTEEPRYFRFLNTPAKKEAFIEGFNFAKIDFKFTPTDGVVDASYIVKLIEKQDVRKAIQLLPDVFNFHDAVRERYFIDGYNYALRDFRIIIEKLSKAI